MGVPGLVGVVCASYSQIEERREDEGDGDRNGAAKDVPDDTNSWKRYHENHCDEEDAGSDEFVLPCAGTSCLEGVYLRL